MDKIISIQKKKEWRAIENIIPEIENYLNIEHILLKEQYESESPDFIFSNGTISIGIEVIECHPSTEKRKKDSAPAINTFQEKICEQFCNNIYLQSITADEDSKLNILVDKGQSFNTGVSINYVCDEIENHLRAWKEKKNLTTVKYIRRIRVMPTVGRNIVQFNCIARRDPVFFTSLKESIKVKQFKLDEYKKKHNCDEFWLCIFLPFEENRQSNLIMYENEGQIEEFNTYVNTTNFNRICVTSVMPTDIHWLKGNPSI